MFIFANLNRDLLLKVRICSLKSKFLPLTVDPPPPFQNEANRGHEMLWRCTCPNKENLLIALCHQGGNTNFPTCAVDRDIQLPYVQNVAVDRDRYKVG